MNKLMSAVKIWRKRKANNTDVKQFIVSVSSFLRLRVVWLAGIWPTSKWEVDRELGANSTFSKCGTLNVSWEISEKLTMILTASAGIVVGYISLLRYVAFEGSWLG